MPKYVQPRIDARHRSKLTTSTRLFCAPWSIVFAGLLLTGCVSSEPRERIAAVLHDNSKAAFVTLYRESHAWSDQSIEFRALVFAVWEDGTVVWAENREGGRPYLRARLPDEELRLLRQELESLCSRAQRLDRTIRYGPDSSFTGITADLGAGTSMYLASWHEGIDASPTLVHTQHGIEALEGRSKEAAEASRTPEYIEFLKLWDDARSLSARTMPRHGERLQPGEVSVEFVPRHCVN